MRRPFRAALAGIVATLVLFGAADLIARAFGPQAAPLLALGQTIIPLTPTEIVKPVIDLFGTNDKLFLILTTGLAALVLGGLIGWLASHRLRLATVLLLAAGLVPILVILIRPESSFIDIIPTVIGLALGLALFRILMSPGMSWTENGTEPAAPQKFPAAARPAGSTTPESSSSNLTETPASEPSRRRFFVITGIIGTVGAAAVAAGQTVASLTLDARAAVAKLVLPAPAKKAPPIPT